MPHHDKGQRVRLPFEFVYFLNNEMSVQTLMQMYFISR